MKTSLRKPVVTKSAKCFSKTIIGDELSKLKDLLPKTLLPLSFPALLRKESECSDNSPPIFNFPKLRSQTP